MQVTSATSTSRLLQAWTRCATDAATVAVRATLRDRRCATGAATDAARPTPRPMLRDRRRDRRCATDAVRPTPPASAAGVDALRVDQGRRHRSAGSQAASSVEGANVCHRSPSDGDNRSSTDVACSHCRLEKESTWRTSLTPNADTHDRCTHGAALVETVSPALPTHSVCNLTQHGCDLTQRDVCDLPQRDVCDLKQRDRCDLRSTAFANACFRPQHLLLRMTTSASCMF